MSGQPQLNSCSLLQLSRLLWKLLSLSATPIASSKTKLSTLLIKTFEPRNINISEFCLTIDAGHIFYFVTCFKIHVKSCLLIMNGVCCYCGLFVWPSSLAVILRSNFIVVTALNNHVINLACLNYCGQKIDKYHFCLPCG